MQTFEKTLKRLTQKRESCQQQIIAIQEFESAMRKIKHEPSVGITNLPAWMSFEVHFRIDSPTLHPIRATARYLTTAYEKALGQWKKHNGAMRPDPGQADVFVYINEMCMAVSPEDAAEIARNEKCDAFSAEKFCLDLRLAEKFGGIIWQKDAAMPEGYAKAETQ